MPEQLVPPIEPTGALAAGVNLRSEICNLKSSEAWSQRVFAPTSPSVCTKRWRSASSRKSGSRRSRLVGIHDVVNRSGILDA